MARLAPKELKLSQSDRQKLQQLVNRHNTPQQIVLRARIILLGSEGKNHGETDGCQLAIENCLFFRDYKTLSVLEHQ